MEGDDIPPPASIDYIAFRIANILGVNRGQIDWGNVPFMASWFGIEDIEGLMVRLFTLANYQPPRNQHGNCHPID